MIDMSSSEYRAMVSCTVNLTQVLAGNIQHIGDVFWQERIIPQGVHEKLMSRSLEPTEKSRVLVSLLTDKVKISSRCFDDILRILREEGDYIADLCDQLEKNRQRFGENRNRNNSEVSTLLHDISEKATSPRAQDTSKGVPSPLDTNEKATLSQGINEKATSLQDTIMGITPPRGISEKATRPRGISEKATSPRDTSECFSSIKYVSVAIIIIVTAMIVRCYSLPVSQSDPLLSNKPRNHMLHSDEKECHLITTKEDKTCIHEVFSKVGDWSRVCIYLNVDSGLQKALQHETVQVGEKIRRCVDAYLDTTKSPCFEDVVKVLCELHKTKFASDLAAERGIDYQTICSS